MTELYHIYGNMICSSTGSSGKKLMTAAFLQ